MDAGFTRNKSFEVPSHLFEYLSTFPVAGAYIGALYEDRVMPSLQFNPATTIHQTRWVGRELIFDLDMDEYDPVRQCDCIGREVCEDCWILMQQAADVMDETFRVDFGFNDLVWVYTGGRGYHCWVLDKITFDLDQDQRSAIIGYMQLIHDPKGNQRIDDIGDYADQLKARIYQKLGHHFIRNGSKPILKNEAGFTDHSLKKARDNLKTSVLLKDIVESIPKGKVEKFTTSLIKYHYPRIDHKVTIDTRRLIRMPGSVHIGTKNVSEILDNPISFNPKYDAQSLETIIGE